MDEVNKNIDEIYSENLFWLCDVRQINAFHEWKGRTINEKIAYKITIIWFNVGMVY